jgi:hypothetical protein
MLRRLSGPGPEAGPVPFNAFRRALAKGEARLWWAESRPFHARERQGS